MTEQYPGDASKEWPGINPFFEHLRTLEFGSPRWQAHRDEAHVVGLEMALERLEGDSPDRPLTQWQLVAARETQRRRMDNEDGLEYRAGTNEMRNQLRPGSPLFEQAMAARDVSYADLMGQILVRVDFAFEMVAQEQLGDYLGRPFSL